MLSLKTDPELDLESESEWRDFDVTTFDNSSPFPNINVQPSINPFQTFVNRPLPRLTRQSVKKQATESIARIRRIRPCLTNSSKRQVSGGLSISLSLVSLSLHSSRTEMMLFKLLFFSIFLPFCLAWGSVGHEIVATIAQTNLHPKVRSYLCQILPEFTSYLTPRGEKHCHLAPLAAWPGKWCKFARNFGAYD